MYQAALVGIAAGLFLYYFLRKSDNRYPPGPWTLPIIGNLPQLALTGSITKFATYYRKIYGDVSMICGGTFGHLVFCLVFTFEFGGHKRVILSGYDVIHSVLVKNGDSSSNRTLASMTKNMQQVAIDTPGLFWAPFPHWKTLRSFAISTLREGGMGKRSMEPRIHEEIEMFINYFIHPHAGQPISVEHSFVKATANIMTQLIFARRFSYDDAEFEKVLWGIDETTKLLVKLAMTENLPFSKYFLKSTLEFEDYLAHTIVTPKFLQLYDEHAKSIDRENPRDITDQYIMHVDTVAHPEASLSHENASLFNIHVFSAGTETTSTSLRWALLFTCLYPDVKERVQKEIDDNIGVSRDVTFKDRLAMPYTEAVLLETLRKGNVVPTALPHTASNDIRINGVIIPAGADLLLNMASVLHDETVFEEPEKFKPERYLTGNIALKKQRTISFGIGRRACLGESLAKMEMFLFYVTILQRFDIRLPDGGEKLDQPIEYIINSPKKHEIIFTPRP